MDYEIIQQVYMKLPEAHEQQVFLPFGHKLPLRGRRQLHLRERDIQRERARVTGREHERGLYSIENSVPYAQVQLFQ